MSDISLDRWVIANEWESKYWDLEVYLDVHQIQTQYTFAYYMGLFNYRTTPNIHVFDLQGKSILDVGGGPYSILLKCINYKKAKIIDPCKFPEWIYQRYKSKNIEFENIMAENMNESGYDEVWIYNVLEHVYKPDIIVKNALKAGKIVRIFEWLTEGGHIGHPQTLTKDKLDLWFDSNGIEEKSENLEEFWLNNPKILKHTIKNFPFYYGVFNNKTI